LLTGILMTTPDRPPLDYAGPHSTKVRTPAQSNGRRLIACAILVFSGAVLVGFALLAIPQFAAINIGSGDVNDVHWVGMLLIGAGGILFLIEYVRGWRSRDE
jgi:hypothetical protein